MISKFLHNQKWRKSHSRNFISCCPCFNKKGYFFLLMIIFFLIKEVWRLSLEDIKLWDDNRVEKFRSQVIPKIRHVSDLSSIKLSWWIMAITKKKKGTTRGGLIELDLWYNFWHDFDITETWHDFWIKFSRLFLGSWFWLRWCFEFGIIWIMLMIFVLEYWNGLVEIGVIFCKRVDIWTWTNLALVPD